MGALMLLCGFFFFAPVLALIAVLATVAVLAGIVAGTASLAGGVVTYLASMAVPAYVVRLVRSKE